MAKVPPFNLLRFMEGLPTSPPAQGGLYVNNGNLALSPIISGTLLPGTLTKGAYDTPYTWTPIVTGGYGTNTFALAGTLPLGLTFSTSTGTISGHILSTASTPISITVTNSGGSATLGPLNFNITSTPINVCTNGFIPNAIGTVSGTRTELAGACTKYFGTSAVGTPIITSFQLRSDNWYLTNDATAETPIPNSVTLGPCYVVYNGIAAQVTWGGSPTRVMASGEKNVLSDPVQTSSFGVSSFTPGSALRIKSQMAVPPAGSYPTSYAGLDAMLNEQAFIYDPAVTPGTIVSGAGAISPPTGATFQVGCPIKWSGVVAAPSVYMPSMLFFGDSIGDGVGEQPNNITTTNGCGFFRRAAGGVSGSGGACVAFISVALTGRKVANFVANYTNQLTLFPIANQFFGEMVHNDAGDPNVNANLRIMWALARSFGMRVNQAIPGPSTSSTDLWFTEANQTPISGFQSGGSMDGVYAQIRTDLSNGLLDNLHDFHADYGATDNTYVWAAPTYQSTFSAALPGPFATVLQLAAPPAVNTTLVIPSKGTAIYVVQSVTGSGPFNVTIGASGIGLAVASGTVIQAINTGDGIHPASAAAAAAATGVGYIFTAAKAGP